MFAKGFTALLAGASLLALTGIAVADPAVVYDLGGKFDKSFNEAAYHGAEMYKKATGGNYADFEIQNANQREQALRNFASKGYSPIVGIGFSQAASIEKVAKEFPKINFAIIDMVVDQPNVASVVFREEQGSYLAGLLAIKTSKTGKVGFVGGMDMALIRKFACGFVQGAKAGNPNAEVYQNMTGTTGAAWNDPVKGAELAKSQMDRGADVIYHAAGGTGLGVINAAADAGKFAIGVDSNQNHIRPGKVLTSVTKGVDVAVAELFKMGKDNTFKPGVRVLGLAENGVDLAIDDNNKALISDAMKAELDKARADIVAGTIKVHDYMTDQNCPVK